VNALRGKKNVIILERTDEAMSPDNPLGKDIRTALSKAIKTEGRPSAEGLPSVSLDEVPTIFGGTYGLGSRDFRPEHIIGAYEYATAGRARKDGKTAADGVSFMVLGIDHPYAVVAMRLLRCCHRARLRCGSTPSADGAPSRRARTWAPFLAI